MAPLGTSSLERSRRSEPTSAGFRRRLRIAYVVSRFPHVSETFILRELNAVAARPDLELHLLSLFAPVSPIVHPAARPWMARLRRPRAAAALAGLAWWLGRRPVRVLATAASIVRAYRRRPSLMVRALATLPIAATHARTARRLDIDHLHAHYATYPALTAWICGRLAGVPYSFTAHAHDIYVDRSGLVERVRDARFVVTISEFNRRLLAELGQPTPVHVVHCGVDAAALRFRPRAVPASGQIRALCVASLQEYKGHHVLLEALSHGGPRLARLDVDLVGSGPLRPELEAQAARLGLQRRVRFHGALPEEAVAQLLDQADLFVLPSLVARNGQMEGLPVALIEALASGLPTVASRLSGIPELVRHGRTGLLAEPGRPESWAAVLEEAIGDPEAALARAAAGRRLVEEEFDLGASVARLSTLFVRSASATTDR